MPCGSLPLDGRLKKRINLAHCMVARLCVFVGSPNSSELRDLKGSAGLFQGSINYVSTYVSTYVCICAALVSCMLSIPCVQEALAVAPSGPLLFCHKQWLYGMAMAGPLITVAHTATVCIKHTHRVGACVG